ncbi:MAG: DUF2911 domain-containing protein [Ferruginibacter sp.]
MSIVKTLLAFASATALLGACNTKTDKSKVKEADATHDKHNMISSSSGYADSVNNGLIAADTMKGSPKRTAMATAGKTRVFISYHSPGVKGRVIWGGLVPYNNVWVTGAHAATSIQINYPVEINRQRIEAGTYAIFTIPGEKEWLFIINKNYQQHLTDDYRESEDVLRIVVKPAENKMTQRLTYTITTSGETGGNILMEWEKIRIAVPFKTLQ